MNIDVQMAAQLRPWSLVEEVELRSQGCLKRALIHAWRGGAHVLRSGDLRGLHVVPTVSHRHADDSQRARHSIHHLPQIHDVVIITGIVPRQ